MSVYAEGSGRYASAGDALDAALGGLSWIATADLSAIGSDERADLARGLVRVDSVKLAADSAALTAFGAAQDYAADGAYGTGPWLAWQARTSRQSVNAKLRWARRLAGHPHVSAALTAGLLSQPWADKILGWLGQLPADVAESAEDILVAAAIGGADLAGLASLFETIRARTARPDTDPDDGVDGLGGDEDGLRSRELFLDGYFRGNGSLRGDLTPEATQCLRKVLDALGARTGPEDLRSKAQRDHDALAEGCRRLIASGMLPQRAGQPVQVVLHMTLSQLLGQAEVNPALANWLASQGVAGAPGADCDAQIVPVVTGNVDPDVLDDPAALADLLGYADTDPDLDRDIPEGSASDSAGEVSDTVPGGTSAGSSLPGDGGVTGTSAGDSLPGAGSSPGTSPDGVSLSGGTSGGVILPFGDAARQRAVAAAVRLLSGPLGAAAWLRRFADPPVNSVSLPLDTGKPTPAIPPHLRRLVTLRDGHCRFPGCEVPAAATQVHHVRHRAAGGLTDLGNLVLLCWHHHQFVVHRLGWQFELLPDGTTRATSPDGRRVLRSHPSPVAA